MKPNHRLTFASLALAAALPGIAWGWNQVLPSPSRDDVRVVLADADDAGNTWALGGIGYMDDYRVLLRYPAGDTAPSVAAPLDVPPFAAYAMLADTDGGVTITGLGGVDDGPEYCLVLHYALNGKLLWQVARPRCESYTATGADAGGERWVHLGKESVRLGGDGRVLARVAREEPLNVLATDAAAGTFYMLDREGTATPAVYAVVAYDRRGAERWRWRNAPAGSTFRAEVAADGTLHVALANPAETTLVAIGTDGRERWSTRIQTRPDNTWTPELVAVAVGTDNATYLGYFSTPDDYASIRRVGADGTPQWTRSADALGRSEQIRSLLAAPDGDLLIGGYGEFTRTANDGTVRYTRTLKPADVEPFVYEYRAIGSSANGDTLFALESPDRERAGGFARLARTGAELAPPARADAVNAATWANRAQLPDGSQIVSTRAERTGVRELMRLSATGGVLWRKAMPGPWTGGRSRQGSLAARGTVTCLLDAQARANDTMTHVVECRRIDDGSLIWSRDVASSPALATETTSRVYLDATGNISAWFESYQASVGFAQFGADGTPRTSKTWASARLQLPGQVDAAFTTLVVGSNLVVTDAAGTERVRRPLDGFDAFSRVAFTDNGSFVTATRQTGQKLVVTSRDATGTAKWTKTFDGSSLTAEQPLIVGDTVYIATCCTRDADGSYVRRIARLSLADGSTAWERPNTTPYYAKQRLLPAPDGNGIVAVGTTGRAVTFDVIDSGSGDVVASHREACSGYECSYVEPQLSADGSVNAFAFAGLSSSLVGWTVPAHGTRLDQPGIAGAWWSPYANGEGFVLDYLPDARVLFMPWFTFSREGGNDPAGQRWYVLQGSVDANATSVELPITESTGGAFDAGPPVTPTIVGTAILRFTDCDNGTLTYRFDQGRNGGATGTITLSRLSPATQNCILADGTTQTRTSTPANGFDARMSGSWFEPATSGQGLQFTVQPGGIFFAPWFAYDPAGNADDPGKQRWYTIQGSLAGARNGVAELPIVQTIGGTFDSVPTNNMVPVGKATITMLACDRAKLDYRFDDTELAASMRARTGSIDLIKAGGCTL